MNYRNALAFGMTVAFAVVACGGSVSSSAGGGGAGGNCAISTLDGSRACVPGTARANTPIEVTVAATGGCLDCFTTFEHCAVSVDGKRISVAMQTKVCQNGGDGACACAPRRTACTIPALAAGTYSLEVAGERVAGGSPPRKLVVTAD